MDADEHRTGARATASDNCEPSAMRVTFADLVVSVPPDQLATLLRDWTWLLGADASPFLVAAAGDVFFTDARGAVHVLDIEEARHECVADSMAEFRLGLRDASTAQRWLGVDRYARAREAGVALPAGSFFSFITPLCLGGEDSVDNLEASDPVVTVSLLGQIHDRIRDLPEGTPLTEFKLR